MILLSDANVLMDLGYVGGLTLLPQLGEVEVLSTVLLECRHHKQPNLVQQIVALGIVIVDVDTALLEAATLYAKEELSLRDRECLLYARDQQRILLTGDQFLRGVAQSENVVCHGSIWLVEEAYRRQLVPKAELCRWLRDWPLNSRRLPKAELLKLRNLLDCQT